jgi:hypothetical protein
MTHPTGDHAHGAERLPPVTSRKALGSNGLRTNHRRSQNTEKENK